MDSHQVHQLLKIQITFAMYDREKVRVVAGLDAALRCQVEELELVLVRRTPADSTATPPQQVGSWQAALEHATAPEKALRHGVTKQGWQN
jgi:hypothetical protein